MKLFLEKKTNLSYILLLTITHASIYINNTFFYVILIFLIFFFYKFNFVFTKKKGWLVRLLPIHFYIYKFIDSYFKKDLLLWDNQYLFNYFKCKTDTTPHLTQLTEIVNRCQKTLGFGPAADLISIKNDPWISSLIIFVIICIYIIYLLISIDRKDIFVFVVLLLSPGFRFLLNSLNSDIFILCFCLYLYRKQKFSLNIVDLIIISFLTQLKIYPIGLIIGYIVVKFFARNYKQAVLSALFFIPNVFSLINHYIKIRNYGSFVDEVGGVPTVYAPISTFGLYADYKAYWDVQLTIFERGNIIFVSCFIFLLVISVIATIKLKDKYFTFNLDNEDYTKFITFLPMILLINLYANFGYKYPLNFLLIFIILKYGNKNLSFFILSSVLVTPMFYLFNLDYFSQKFFATSWFSVVWLLSRYSFYMINFLYLIIAIDFLKSKLKVSY